MRWTKWLAAGVFVLAAAGCTSDSPDRNTVTEQASGSAVSETCPLDAAICEFAERFQSAVIAADFAALAAMSEAQRFTCAGPEPGGAGGPYPLCDGSVAGETRTGFRVDRLNSDGGTVEVGILPQMRLTILARRQNIQPEVDTPGVIGVQCPIRAGAAACAEEFTVYFEGAPHVAAEHVGAGYAITRLQLNDFAQDSSVFEAGGDFPFVGSRGLEDGKFFPWRPQRAASTTPAAEQWLFAPAEITGVDVRPEEGSCEGEITIEVPTEAPVPPPKGPAQVQVRLVQGAAGPEAGLDRKRPHEVIIPTRIDGTNEFAFALSASMLSGGICDAEVLTLVTGGGYGWHVAGYRVQ